MKILFRISCAILVCLATTVTAQAKIIVDHFTVDQEVKDDQLTASTTSTMTIGGDLNADRTMEVEITNSGSPDNAKGLAVLKSKFGPTDLQFLLFEDSTPSVNVPKARFTIEWTNFGQTGALGATGNEVDLTEGSVNTGILLQGVRWSTDSGQNMTLNIEILNGNVAVAQQIINTTGSSDYFVPFSGFTVNSGTLQHTLENATKIRIFVSSTDPVSDESEFRLDALIITTPEPASIALLGIGLLGLLGYVIRRRRKESLTGLSA